MNNILARDMTRIFNQIINFMKKDSVLDKCELLKDEDDSLDKIQKLVAQISFDFENMQVHLENVFTAEIDKIAQELKYIEDNKTLNITKSKHKEFLKNFFFKKFLSLDDALSCRINKKIYDLEKLYKNTKRKCLNKMHICNRGKTLRKEIPIKKEYNIHLKNCINLLENVIIKKLSFTKKEFCHIINFIPEFTDETYIKEYERRYFYLLRLLRRHRYGYIHSIIPKNEWYTFKNLVKSFHIDNESKMFCIDLKDEYVYAEKENVNIQFTSLNEYYSNILDLYKKYQESEVQAIYDSNITKYLQEYFSYIDYFTHDMSYDTTYSKTISSIKKLFEVHGCVCSFT